MNTSTLRQPAVADRFYSGDPDELRQTVTTYLQTDAKPASALAVIAPHAGYIYSGSIAGETIGQVEIPETVIILGPNHSGQGTSVALSTSSWQMPMGTVPIDTDIAGALLQDSDCIIEDERAHRFEHSLEVQVPFLQAMQKNLSIVPLCISTISYPLCQSIGASIARVIEESGKKDKILILASTDMTHFESRESAMKKDGYALKKIEILDPSALYRGITGYHISMCGYIPVTIAMIASLAMGATQSKLVRYTDSGETSGDTTQVVGYAGVIIS